MRRTLATLLLALVAGPGLAYTLYFKDGSTLGLHEKYTVEGDHALLVLENGTRSSVPLAEIDVELTERNNRGALSDALVVQDGELVALEEVTEPEPPRPTLGSLIASGRVAATAAPSAGMEAPTDTGTSRRGRLDDEELADRIFRGLRERGIGAFELRRGDREGHAFLEITTDTEAAVFQGLETAAEVLARLAEEESRLRGFELQFRTSEHAVAGDFVLTPDLARQLVEGRVETPTFYVRHVAF